MVIMERIELRKKIGIALGSGSARGLAHIGVLKTLEHAGIEIGYIAGTSIGALIGGAYAAGITTEELTGIACQLDWKRLIKLFLPSFSRKSLISDREVNEFLESMFGSVKIENLRIPFCAVAADLVTGERVVISEGKLSEAVRASISIPIIFKPAKLNGHLMIDGGLVDPVPVESVYEMGAEYVVAVPLTRMVYTDQEGKSLALPVKKKFDLKTEFDDKVTPVLERLSNFLHLDSDKFDLKYPFKHEDFQSPEEFNIISTFWQSIRVAERELTRLRLQITPPDLLIEPEVEQVQLWEYNRAVEAIAAGKVATKQALQGIDSK